MNRQTRAKTAEDTLAILRSGSYVNGRGERVSISAALDASVRDTQLIRPHEWPAIIARARQQCTASPRTGIIEVTDETTLGAARRLVVKQRLADVAILNFASAKNPGGGFLSGSQAQEESLARSSGLYAALQAAPEYYAANRKHGSPVYTDHAIFSPRVPVFRDDAGALLDEPYFATFITMPAVNVGALPRTSPQVPSVPQVMQQRMHCVFALAASTGHRALVLGAWGCGVFRNDAGMIAQLFAQCLPGPDSWRACFDRIVFAVYDTSPDRANLSAFERHLNAVRS